MVIIKQISMYMQLYIQLNISFPDDHNIQYQLGKNCAMCFELYQFSR